MQSGRRTTASGSQPPRRREPLVDGPKISVRAGDTWASLALKHYGDAMLGAALCELNGWPPQSKPGLGDDVVLPPADELNRRINVAAPERNPFLGCQDRHVLPTRDAVPEDENSVARDARTRLLRASAGLGLHAKGGGWKPVSQNLPAEAKKKRRRKPAPELDDRWLRRLARLSPRSAMKVARLGTVGTGPTLTLLGGLREADSASERMELVQRFLAAYGSEAHVTLKELLRAVAA
ncbi:MAG: hypothetical protein JXR83_21040 [Deltaproteobacteria bacterium]|nr:hypothetical protein [Deltaproteobacteria bacterium]